MRWTFLDTGPLDILAAAWTLRPWTWSGKVLHVVDAVAKETAGSHRGRELLSRCGDDSLTWVRQHSLLVGSAAQRFYTDQLRPKSSESTTNVGEDVSIALLATEFDGGVFVTMDGRATLSGLLHLGPGRIETPFDCWAWLEESGHVDATSRADLDRLTEKRIGRQRPRRFDRAD